VRTDVQECESNEAGTAKKRHREDEAVRCLLGKAFRVIGLFVVIVCLTILHTAHQDATESDVDAACAC
jgi:hypothetical protein